MYTILKYIVIIIAFILGIIYLLAPGDKIISKEQVSDENERKKQIQKKRILGAIIVVGVILIFIISIKYGI